MPFPASGVQRDNGLGRRSNIGPAGVRGTGDDPTLPIQDFTEQAFPLLTVFVFVLGTCIGSFLNVCIWRLPRGESLVHPGSHCPRCGHEIRPWENIPLLSWLFLRGRCSSCRLPISVRYPAVEGATGILFLALWLRVYFTGLPLGALPGYLFLGGLLLAAAVIDAEHRLIPDALTLTGIAAAVVLALFFPSGHPLAGGPTGLACPGHFWSLAALDVTGTSSPDLAQTPRFAAVLDTTLGAATGIGFLWIVREFARLFWGAATVRPEQPTPIVLTAESVQVGEDPATRWDAVLRQGNRAFSARVRIERVRLRDTGESKPETSEAPTIEGEQRITVRAGVLRTEATRVRLTDVLEITGEALEWTEPREVLGLGDIKLLGAIGAFLGPEAVMFVVLLSAAAGTLTGAVLTVSRRGQSGQGLPYGPFLAGAALTWMLAGTELVTAYGRFLLLRGG